MRLRLVFVLCLGLTTAVQSAPKSYVLSPGVKDAYQKAVNLRLGEARSAIEALKKSEPDNLFPIFIENYADFLTAFLSDSPSDYNRLSKGMSPRLAQLAKGDPRSPWHLYAQAEIRFQWALLRGRFNNYMSSLSEIKQALALLEENAKRHPDFAPNKKKSGPHPRPRGQHARRISLDAQSRRRTDRHRTTGHARNGRVDGLRPAE